MCELYLNKKYWYVNSFLYLLGYSVKHFNKGTSFLCDLKRRTEHPNMYTVSTIPCPTCHHQKECEQIYTSYHLELYASICTIMPVHPTMENNISKVTQNITMSRKAAGTQFDST